MDSQAHDNTESKVFFTMMPLTALRDGSLSHSDLVVLGGTASFRNSKTRRCDPTHEQIAERVDVSVSTVRRSLERLRNKEHMAWTHRARYKGGWGSNEYAILGLDAGADGRSRSNGDESEATVAQHGEQAVAQHSEQATVAQHGEQAVAHVPVQTERVIEQPHIEKAQLEDGSEEDEAVVVLATSSGGIPPFSDEALEAAMESTEPGSEADAAERPLPDDEKIPADLRARNYTYLIDAKPTKKGDNHRAFLGDGKVLFVDSPVVYRDVKEHIGKLIRPFIRPGVARDSWVLDGFRPAPTPEERREELIGILDDALMGREGAASFLDDVAFADPIFPDFAGTLPPEGIIRFARKRKWPCRGERLRDVLDRLGYSSVEIPEAVPEPVPDAVTEPEPGAGPERRITMEEVRASLEQMREERQEASG